MSKRVLIGGLHHESDTFNPIITSEKDIWVYRGQELINHKDKSSISGIIKTFSEVGYQIIPTLVARAVPNGEWSKEYYLSLKEELLDGIRKAGKLDAICLSLHGSMRVKDIGEAEGDLLESIRTILPNILIISSLDMHATISKRMIKYCNGFVGYKCAPHTDTFETGIQAAKMTINCLENSFTPFMSSVHIPFLVAGEQSETSVEPMKSYTNLLRSQENENFMACSILLGFPWADTEENGASSLVVSRISQSEADNKAMELATIFWNRRKEFGFYNETRMPKDALSKTLKSIENNIFPVVISDSGDNPTAGSSQDVTNFLKMIISDEKYRKLNPPLVYQAIYDSPVVELAKEVGIGKYIKTTLGSKYDIEKSSPIKINALVKEIYIGLKSAENCDVVLLDIEGVDVIVTNKHVGCYDLEMMRCVKIDPTKCKAIVVKLGYLEPEIRSISKRSIMALTTGSSDELFERLDYKKIKRPIYPLDGDFETELNFIK